MRIHDQDHTTGGQNAIEEFLQRRFKTDCFAVDDAINEACNNISQKYDIGLDKIQEIVMGYLPEKEGNILRIDGLLVFGRQGMGGKNRRTGLPQPKLRFWGCTGGAGGALCNP